MNVLVICSAKVWGGNEKWTSMAIEALKSEHNLVFLGKNPELFNKFGKGIKHYSAPFTWNFDLKTKKIVKQLIEEHKIDIILSTKKKEYFIAGSLAKKLKIPHIIRLGIVRKMKHPLWSKYVYNTLNDGIIVNANKIKENLLRYKYFEHHNIKVMYNGITPPKTIRIPHNNRDEFHIVFVGMLTKRKGCYILIDAISKLSAELKKRLKLTLVGEGREEEELKRQVASLGLNDTVNFAGFSNTPQVYLSKADLFALISGNEGISNALIEAMYMQIPVLTTNAGGAAEIVLDNDTGFICNRDAHVVANKIEEIMKLSNPELDKVAKNGKIMAQNTFNTEKMNKELLTFVDEVVELKAH